MASLYKKPIVVRDPNTGEKAKAKSKKWWGRYTDALGREKRIPLATDRRVAQTMLNDLVQKVERQQAGLEDPTEEQMQRPVAEHLADFERSQNGKNNSPRYVFEITAKLRRIVNACGWPTVMQITSSDIEGFLADLREGGLSVQTSNHYLRAIKSFTRWLVINRRLKSNPLDSLSMLNTRVDRRHDRRPLTQDEFTRLIEAAETGPLVESIPGIDRAMLYVLAAWTGLRKGEIGSLTRANFRLDANPPTVTIAAAYSKHRREDTQVLHPEVVQRLRDWLELRQPDDNDILFPISQRTSGYDRKTAKMMRDDLAAARRAWIAETNDAKEIRHRKKSDFLEYQDAAGRFADFHSLRHTFVTNLARANIAPKTAQALARHSDIRLTMNVYTHVNQEEQAAAIAQLPGLDGGQRKREAG